MRVSTVSGVVISAGIGVVIFIFGAPCTDVTLAVSEQARAAARMVVVFMSVFLSQSFPRAQHTLNPGSRLGRWSSAI